MKRQPIIRFDRARPSRTTIHQFVDCLRHGSLAVAPSETQYALCALAVSGDAVRAVRELKGRRETQPFSAFFESCERLARWGIRVPGYAARLAEEFWPGPLTLVLPASGRLARRLGGTDAIGVRVSPEPLIQRALVELDAPIVATSANPSGAVMPPRAENRWLQSLAESDRIQWFRPQRYSRSRASTVIACTGPAPRLLRDGAITRSQWLAAIR